MNTNFANKRKIITLNVIKKLIIMAAKPTSSETGFSQSNNRHSFEQSNGILGKNNTTNHFSTFYCIEKPNGTGVI